MSSVAEFQCWAQNLSVAFGKSELGRGGGCILLPPPPSGWDQHWCLLHALGSPMWGAAGTCYVGFVNKSFVGFPVPGACVWCVFVPVSCVGRRALRGKTQLFPPEVCPEALGRMQLGARSFEFYRMVAFSPFAFSPLASLVSRWTNWERGAAAETPGLRCIWVLGNSK